MSNADSSPLFSAQWYRVSSLRPALDDSLQVNCQSSRGQRWYLLSLPGQSKRVRINETGYEVIGRCDGRQSLDNIFKALLQSDPESVASQTEVIELMGKLVADGYLSCDDWPDLETTLEEQDKKRKQERRKNLNPVAPRVSLINPNRQLAQLDPIGQFLFSKSGLLLWLCVLMLGSLAALTHTEQIRHHGVQWLASPSMWLISALCFPLVKLIHEVSHGLAVRRWGGEVTDAGIALLLLFPTPYVDASDANQFSRASQRAWVSAAGIVAELAIAAVAIIGWCLLEDGVMRNTLFSAALIASVSTLAFNANPLVRLDGYYVLSDLAGLPNLTQRSQQFWRATLSKYLLQIDLPGLNLADGERRWVQLYQPLSWLYRLSIFFWFSWWVSMYSMSAALVVASCAVAWLLLWPAAKLFALPFQTGKALSEATNSWLRLTTIGITLVALSLIPIPDRTLAQGIVWTPEESLVRARHQGFVRAQANPDKQSVENSQVLFALEDPIVDANIKAIESRLPGLQSAWIANLNTDPARARQNREAVNQAKRELAFAADAKSRLAVISPSRGQFRLHRQWQDMVDQFVNEGDLLGHVDRNEAPVVRVVLTQNQAARVRSATEQSRNVLASIRFANETTAVRAATLKQSTPGPATALPSAALATQNGGQIEVQADANEGLTPVHPSYLIDVVASEFVQTSLGSRAWVRLDFGTRSAAGQLVRWVRQLINSETISHFG